MGTRRLFISSVLCITGAEYLTGQQTVTPSSMLQQHQEWVFAQLRRMEAIKSGMTRGDLLKVFRMEGGLYPRDHSSGHYALDDCMYFKVDVQFKLVGPMPSNADIITTISKPYIQRPILD